MFDPLGRATAAFSLPPVILQFLAGLAVYWSFLGVTPGGLPACVGDTRTMLLTL